MMEELTIEKLAVLIAKKLNEIKVAETEKIIIQNKLDTLFKQTEGLKEDLNKLDAIIASKKYEISNKLSNTNNLFLVKTGE